MHFYGKCRLKLEQLNASQQQFTYGLGQTQTAQGGYGLPDFAYPNFSHAHAALAHDVQLQIAVRQHMFDRGQVFAARLFA